MRYGHQPWDVLMEMSLDDLYVMADEIADMVNRENGPAQE